MISRIYESLLLLIEFVVNFLKIYHSKKVPLIVENKLSPIDKYIIERKEVFLRSYENSIIDWNENINDDYENKTDEIIKKWKSKMLFESTPRGNILLMYDIEKKAFNYYMDTSGVSYMLLNAVAMKFVILFRCRDFFIDENIIPIGKTSQLITDMNFINKKEIDEKNELVNNLTNCAIDEINSPFAKLKSRVNNKKVRFEENDTIKFQNKFISQGKINNLTFHQKGANKNIIEPKKLSYKSYKRVWQNMKDIEVSDSEKITYSSDFDHSYDICDIGGMSVTDDGVLSA